MMSKEIYLEQVQLWVNGCYDGALDGISGRLTRAGREKYKELTDPVETYPRKIRLMRPSECTLHLNGAPAAPVYIEQLDGVPCCGSKCKGTIRCNERVADDLVAIFRDIEHAGLLDRIISYDGCYANRNVRGGNTLSMHARGAAIDLNAQWNAQGSKPARIGMKGSVAEIVPIFATYGWYWGGNFAKSDGMHFEKCIVI